LQRTQSGRTPLQPQEERRLVSGFWLLVSGARTMSPEEAQALSQLAFSKSEKYDPARGFPPKILPIGFVYSSVGIRRLIDRNRP